MDNEFSDVRMQNLLKKYIRSECTTADKEHILKNILRCGEATIKLQEPAVFVVRSTMSDNTAKTKFAGLIRCRSAWACPFCTANVMEQKSQEIATALEALAMRNLWAAMITFTIPHSKQQSCHEVYTILRNTWRRFARSAGTQVKKNHTRSDGTTVQYLIDTGAYCKFRRLYDSRYNVRVFEFTWSPYNGWHPHIHALYWFPKDKFNNIINAEASLQKYWDDCAQQETLKFYMALKDVRFGGDSVAVENFVESIISKSKIAKHSGVYISKNKDGSPRRMTSSLYVGGMSKWSAESELTSFKVKQAAKGHYSVFQLLECAKAATEWSQVCKWLDLFIEYAKTVWATRRVQWCARTDIKKIIADWTDEHGEIQLHKKKATRVASTVVFWFTDDEWYSICHFNRTHPDECILAEILERARLPDATQQIDALLTSHGFCSMLKNHSHIRQQMHEFVA